MTHFSFLQELQKDQEDDVSNKPSEDVLKQLQKAQACTLRRQASRLQNGITQKFPAFDSMTSKSQQRAVTHSEKGKL